jgi:hypothetical protein
VPPTGLRVSAPVITVVGFDATAVHSEHIYWDQTSVPARVGLFIPATVSSLPMLVDQPAVLHGRVFLEQADDLKRAPPNPARTLRDCPDLCGRAGDHVFQWRVMRSPQAHSPRPPKKRQSRDPSPPEHSDVTNGRAVSS